MTLSEIYRQYLRELETLYSKSEAAQITTMAFESIAHCERSDVIKEPGRIVPLEIVSKLQDSLGRLMNHEPIQHITGTAWFCDLQFKVSRDVLVPRPETEELVALVANFVQDEYASILDIGTGSGCIAIALKKKKPACIMTAIDISESALEFARENSTAHKADVILIANNFLNENSWNHLPKVHVIVSNPPYIPPEDETLLDKNVSQFEPHLALFEPPGQPYIFYKEIAKFGKSNLFPGGKIFVEIHEDFANPVRDIFAAQGYDVEVLKDMFGKDRFVAAKTTTEITVRTTRYQSQ